VLKPGPLRSGVILKFGKIGYQRDGVQENETISLMAEGGMVTDVIVLRELLQGLDAADVVVPREKVNGNLEVGERFLESLDFVVEPIELVSTLLNSQYPCEGLTGRWSNRQQRCRSQSPAR
jgi:hypothetical protein